MTGNTPLQGFAASVERRMPLLFAIWLLITVLAPHQEIYKIFFHGIVIPATLILLYSGRANIKWRDPVLLLTILLAMYSSINTFIVGQGPIGDHIRAARWGVETFFCLLAFFLWLPAVLARPAWWGRYFMLLALIGATGGFLLFAAGISEDRLTGLGALYNPIQASSILLVYLAIGHYLVFIRKPSAGNTGETPADGKAIWLLLTSSIAVALFVLMSQSRAAIMVMALLLVYIGVRALLHNLRLKTGLAMLGGAAVIIGLLEIIYGLDHYHELLFMRGLSYRFDIWQGYLLYPPDSWILGFGAGTDPGQLEVSKEFWGPSGKPILNAHAHNLWLGTLVENGLIGLGFLVGIAALLLKSAFSDPGPWGQRIGLMMILLLVFLLTLTGSHTLIISAKAIWLFGWLPLLFVWFSSKYTQYNNLSQ